MASPVPLLTLREIYGRVWPNWNEVHITAWINPLATIADVLDGVPTKLPKDELQKIREAAKAMGVLK